ncbi:MAG: response regulator, partial [Candidatus Obscuribacterales bacterium]|nr:response regulator [Candidatus Obscuribacterales bacterium]
MPRILLVEDHDDLRAMMHERLLKEEYQVNVFDNGLDAHYCLQTTTFDLLILDWELPGMAGIEILKRFREAGGTTPVLMLTGR